MIRTQSGLMLVVGLVIAGCSGESPAPMLVPEEKEITVHTQPCGAGLDVGGDGTLDGRWVFEHSPEGRREDAVMTMEDGSYHFSYTLANDHGGRPLLFEYGYGDADMTSSDRTTYHYDVVGRLMRRDRVSESFYDRITEVETVTSWNHAGRPLSSSVIWEQVLLETGEVETITAAGTYVYDGFGRRLVEEVKAADGTTLHSRRSSYDDVARTRTDLLVLTRHDRGRKSVWTFDERARPIQYLGYSPAERPTPSRVFTFEYDGDRLIRETASYDPAYVEVTTYDFCD